MAIRSDDITQIIKSAIDEFDSGIETRSVGTVVEVGDGIARIYGLEGALASELLEFPGGIKGMALNLEEETVGAVILGDYTQIKEGDTVKTTGSRRRGAGRAGPHRPRRGRPRAAHRRQGPARPRGDSRAVERVAPGVITPQVGRHARADRHQGHRRPHPHRARPARAHHRRPPDGQDHGRRGHHHQPEGQGPRLHLRGHRPEALDGGQDGGRAGAVRRHGAHHRRGGRCRRPGARCSTWRPTPARPWASTSWRRASRSTASSSRTPCASTTTSPSTPGPTGRWPCCCAVRPAARPTQATSSTCTAASWSGRRA